jgi:hypothetical protein
MPRPTRRDFVITAGGFAALPGVAPARVTSPQAYFTITSFLFSDSESARQFQPPDSQSILLEAIIAPHVPQYLAISPAKASGETLVGIGDWSELKSVGRVYELRKYSIALDGTPRLVPKVSVLHRNGIRPILHGTDAGKEVYLLEFESLEARTNAWGSLAANEPSRYADYEVSLFRRVLR